TMETAETIAEAIGRAPSPQPALREQDLGDANHLSVEDANRIALNPTEGPPADRVFFPHAETWREMMARLFDFLGGRAGAGKPHTALLVSHAGASNCIVFWWLGLSPDRWPEIQFEFDLCSITELTLGDFHGRRVRRLNDTRHLTPLAQDLQ
ncbi:MAG: histidine phosphatase family protein, partial [Phycisphaerae bacterium]